jgi:hypothetical protein
MLAHGARGACSAIKWDSAFAPKVTVGTNYLRQLSSSGPRHRLQVLRSGDFVFVEAEQTFYGAARVDLTYQGPPLLGDNSLAVVGKVSIACTSYNTRCDKKTLAAAARVDSLLDLIKMNNNNKTCVSNV